MLFSRSPLKRFTQPVALFVIPALLMLVPLTVRAQSSFDHGRPGQLSKQKAADVLNEFRSFRVRDFCFRITITHVPKKNGAETVHYGTMWGSWNNNGPVFRIELTPAKASPAAPLRFILQSGPRPALWIAGENGKPVRTVANTNEPLAPGLIISALELQQQFTYWANARYLETRRFRGRPTNFFRMTPPASFRTAHPNIGHVTLGFDRAFPSALMQAVVHDANGRELRKVELESFTKAQDNYIPEEIRMHDMVTRDKDIFRITAASLKQPNPPTVFDPATLGSPAPTPPENLFEVIN
ncbi:MAG: hypothetical protein LBS59_01455 [Puniceicoccales bacterium]|jgi:hypothetical protein|nr:hypothetical protein [Puniceicoccales bacterium]